MAWVRWVLVLLLTGALTSNASATAPGCPTDVKSILGVNGHLPSLAATLATPILASDQPIVLHLDEDVDDSKRIRAAVNLARPVRGAVQRELRVLSWAKSSDGSGKGSDLTLSPIRSQDLNSFFFTRAHLVVAQCSADGLDRSFETSSLVSGRLIAIVAAVGFTALMYVLAARTLSTSTGRSRYSPLRMATDGSGRASLANMQILFFSIVVLFMVTYIVVRTGMLANLSDQVLLLLGIAGAGSVGGTLATTNRRRISFDNWAWAKRKGWIGPSGYNVENPSWSDLFSTDGDFDPYKFQMLSFSFVVGVSLLILGVNGLASFTIPSALLGVIGLSQVTYLGGKIVMGSTFGDLDDKLTALRKAETDFITSTAASWLPPVPTAGSLVAATALKPDEYMKFKALVGPAWTMFQELFESQGPTPVFEPTL